MFKLSHGISKATTSGDKNSTSGDKNSIIRIPLIFIISYENEKYLSNFANYLSPSTNLLTKHYIGKQNNKILECGASHS